MAHDTELLEAWRGGDRQAGSALFDRYFVSLYGFFRTKISGEVDDLVQATFLRCSQAAHAIADGGSFRAYLFAIARNVLSDHYRQQPGRQAVELDSTSLADLGVTPTQILAERQEHRMLLAGLRQLCLDDQIALELMYWERLTGGEIARVLGVPEGTARTRIRAARRSLERAIARIAETPELLRSTMDNLEQWSASVREYLMHDAASR